MTTPSFSQLAGRLVPGSPYVDLFTIDASANGGPVERWTPGEFDDAPVSFGGNIYTALPIDASNFEWNGQGPLPTPTLRIANINSTPMAILIANNDLLGATVTRIQTFACFLDGAEYADSGAYSEPAIFRVNRKSHADKNFVELELAAATDQQGKQLPLRQVWQNTCSRTYRVWNGTAFIQGQCPYRGTNYFDSYDNPQTNPALDQCSRTLTGCTNRFGTTELLPTWAFPGVQVDTGANAG